MSVLFTRDYWDKAARYKALSEVCFRIQNPLGLLLALPCRVPVLGELCGLLACAWPVGGLGYFLRATYWRTRLGGAGSNLFVDRGVSIQDPADVRVGHDVYLDENVIIRTTGGELVLGDYVRLAAGTYIQAGGGVEFRRGSATSAYCIVYSQTHYYQRDGETVAQSSMLPETDQVVLKSRIVVGEGSLLGARSTLLPGASVGRYSTVGAHSLVKTPVPDYSIVAGCPAKLLKELIACSCSRT